MSSSLCPKISVLLCVYNCEQHIRKTIESILVQDYSNFEFIIIDDASTDRTKEIVYEERDHRIRFYRNEENIGLGPSLNKGLGLARGSLIARIDADDVALPSRFSNQVKEFDRQPDLFALGTCARIINENGDKRGKKLKPQSNFGVRVYSFFSNPVIHPSVMYRKAEAIRIGGYPDWRRGQDYAFFTLALNSGLKIRNLGIQLVEYRVPDKATNRSGPGRYWCRRARLFRNMSVVPPYKDLQDLSRSLYGYFSDLFCLVVSFLIVRIELVFLNAIKK